MNRRFTIENEPPIILWFVVFMMAAFSMFLGCVTFSLSIANYLEIEVLKNNSVSSVSHPTHNFVKESLVLETIDIGSDQWYDVDQKKCFYQPSHMCSKEGICTHESPVEFSCPLEIESEDKTSPIAQLYRELLSSDQLPSDLVIKEAKHERDKELERLRQMENEVKQRIEHITESARKKSKSANAEAVRNMMTAEIDEETIRKIAKEITGK